MHFGGWGRELNPLSKILSPKKLESIRSNLLIANSINRKQNFVYL